MREFLYVDDLASACIHVMHLDRATYDINTEPMLSHINVGTGVDCSIKELVETISKVVEFKGKIYFDASKPDGTPKKLMDISKLESLGWQHQVSLEHGLKKTYQWFLCNQEKLRS
jgi:GDP-L-fucose synthase